MTYRNIDTQIWRDGWFMELDPDEKLLFIYLFSNDSTRLVGLYKLPKRVIEFETGLTKEFINETLEKFEQAGKVYYRDGIVWVVNLRKYNESRSPKVAARIKWELDQIPDCELKIAYLQRDIQYQYPIDTTSTLTVHNSTVHNSTPQDSTENTTTAPATIATTTGEAYTKFQNEIGLLSPVTADMIGGWIDDYSEPWIIDAISEAVKNNVRKPAYIDAILKRWKNEGRGNGKAKDSVKVWTEVD